MNQVQTLREFVGGNISSPSIDPAAFLLNLSLTALLCFLLGQIYIRFGRSLSNRATLARNFVVLGMTTMLIISIIKSSLALSLGLVGALSIVRFRTAIKEPEELSYLFLTIAIGLGLGADQRLVTALGFTMIAAILALKGLIRTKPGRSNLYLIVNSSGPRKISLERMTQTLEENCSGLDLKRFDESDESLEASYLVSFDNFRQLERAKQALQSQGDSIRVSFVDNDGVA